MTLPIRFDDEAEEEFESAAVFYEERREGLGIAFSARWTGRCSGFETQGPTSTLGRLR